ncbi:MAG: O-acetyl-ADP-ribose deacetylase [Flavobacteriia bacterium]|nr:O-acetyl-ADP-ribose deacetylase [Flavobacteriia bacterium]
MTDIEIIQADITHLNLDAIVNAANNSLMGGGGVDGAIHRAAGAALAEECRLLRGCETGQSKITKGYNLPAKFVIHTVGPVWNNGTNNEEFLLQSCYETALKLAVENGIKTIAFPSISTGAYRFPFSKAAEIAYSTITAFLKENPSIEQVFLVCFDEKDLKQLKRIISRL